MLKILLVGIGGFVGASGRYLLSTLLQQHQTTTFPFATLVVNFIACLLMGFLTATLANSSDVEKQRYLFATTGMLGGFSTMSTFSMEAIVLLDKQQWGFATFYLVGGMLSCLLGFVLGRLLARQFA